MTARTVERRAPRSALVAEVLAGLRRPLKQLSPKFFYDEVGAALFERICTLPEYYPTRTELGILVQNAAAIAKWVGPRARIIEFGSGSGDKTRLLLEHLEAPAEYIPIDIATAQLTKFTQDLAANPALGGLRITPISQDYTRPVTLPPTGNRSVVFFPGSTIGNFEPEDALAFLRRAAHLVGPGGGLLIGVDLRKEPALLERAYNDAAGVTAAFNLNMLTHINRICDADFDITRFQHRAVYDRVHHRIEMYLVSTETQTVTVAGAPIEFDRGESILTEYSYKYDLAGFRKLALRAGFTPATAWTDASLWFSVQAFDAT